MVFSWYVVSGERPATLKMLSGLDLLVFLHAILSKVYSLFTA